MTLAVCIQRRSLQVYLRFSPIMHLQTWSVTEWRIPSLRGISYQMQQIAQQHRRYVRDLRKPIETDALTPSCLNVCRQPIAIQANRFCQRGSLPETTVEKSSPHFQPASSMASFFARQKTRFSYLPTRSRVFSSVCVLFSVTSGSKRPAEHRRYATIKTQFISRLPISNRKRSRKGWRPVDERIRINHEDYYVASMYTDIYCKTFCNHRLARKTELPACRERC